MDQFLQALQNVGFDDVLVWALTIVVALFAIAPFLLLFSKWWMLSPVALVIEMLSMMFGLPYVIDVLNYKPDSWITMFAKGMQATAPLYLAVYLFTALCVFLWKLYQSFRRSEAEKAEAAKKKAEDAKKKAEDEEKEKKADDKPKDKTKDEEEKPAEKGWQWPAFDGRIAALIAVCLGLLIVAVVILANRPRTPEAEMIARAQRYPGNPYKASLKPHLQLLIPIDEMEANEAKEWKNGLDTVLAKDLTVNKKKVKRDVEATKVHWVFHESTDYQNLDGVVAFDAKSKSTGKDLGTLTIRLRKDIGKNGFQVWVAKNSERLGRGLGIETPTVPGSAPALLKFGTYHEPATFSELVPSSD